MVHETGGQTADQHQDRRSSVSRHSWWLIFIIIICILGAYFLYKRFESSRPGPARVSPRVPVVAAAAVSKDVNVYLTGLGAVTPLQTVNVKTRVDGQLVNVFFKEGQIVRREELLAQIDPRPFEVQLLQAQGQMARDEALLKNAEVDLERYKLLWQQNSIPQQQLDTQAALVRQYLGALETDKGLIDNAKLQLVYTRIAAPVAGRVGLRLVDPGNIVHAADTNGLVVITQIQPISVIFSIPEDNLQPVLDKLRSGTHLPVEAYNRDLTRKLSTGSLLTVDNQIDPNTGTVRLRALFPNNENELFPNQFVNARLLVNVISGAVVVPSPAVQRGPQGTYVYLVAANRTASVQPVVVGETQAGESVIRKGLVPGDLVVVEGTERLRPGASLEIRR